MDVSFTVTDQGKTVVSVTVTDDGKVDVRTSGKQMDDATSASGAAQYVWGATNVAERGEHAISVALTGENMDSD